MAKGRTLVLVWVLYGFLYHCGAVDLNCTVTRDGQRTTYSLSQKFPVSTSNQFDYSWANATHHVLATPGNNSPLVITSSMDTLVTSRCINSILFAGTSYSESKDYKATCTINCTAQQTAPPQVTDTVPWDLVIGVLIGILLLAGLCILCYILCFRDGIRRRCSCSQVGGFYSAVKMNNPVPQEVEV